MSAVRRSKQGNTMRRRLKLITRCGVLLAAALIATTGSAAPYRWKDPATGRIIMSDQAPPPGVKLLGRPSPGSLAPPADTSILPLATRRAIAEFPVVLYTANDCLEACADARGLLNRRGVPFTERNASRPEHLESLRTLGEARVPTLRVGRQTLRGFDTNEWHATLTLAGYPEQAPPGYRAPEPPAPEPAPESEANETVEPVPVEEPPPDQAERRTSGPAY